MTVTAVPEPATYVMLAIAAGIGAIAAPAAAASQRARGARWFAAQARPRGRLPHREAFSKRKAKTGGTVVDLGS